MEIFKKTYSCINQPALLILYDQILYANSTNLYMVLSKPLELGPKNFIMHLLLLVLHPQNLTNLSSLTSPPIPLLTNLSMLMIPSLLEIVSPSFNKQSPNLITNLILKIQEPQTTFLASKQQPPLLDCTYHRVNIFQTSLPKQRCSMPNQFPHQ